jgi:hypothetical protein
MHNLDTNFKKVKRVCKELLKNHLDGSGNVAFYPNPPQMTDIEVIALAILSEQMSISSENWLFGKLNSDYKKQFPRLVSRVRFNVRKRKLHAYINEVSVLLANRYGNEHDTLIIDSAPVPICENARIHRTKICRDNPDVQPDRGFDASHNKYYFGFKIQLLITEKGWPVASSLYPASCHDSQALQAINELHRTDFELIGDRGFISTPMKQTLFDDLKIRLITPLRTNMTKTVNEWTTAHRYKRKRIETTFSQLLDQFNLRKNYAKTLDGLLTRVVTKIAAFSISQFFNLQNNRPLNHIKYALAF